MFLAPHAGIIGGAEVGCPEFWVPIVVLACVGKTRIVATALAIPFAVSAITFHLQLYAELTPVGKGFGWAFFVQIALILVWGFVTKAHATFRMNTHNLIGVAIALFGLVLYPMLGLVTERGWEGAEYFGMAPDPTIAFFLGIVLIGARPVWLWLFLLLPVPLLWVATTALTLDSLEAPFAMTLPIVAAITIVAAIWKAIFDRPHPA